MTGTITRQKRPNSVLPSIRAASSSSDGIPMMYCRMRKITRAFTENGRIRPQYVLISPSFTISP